MCQRQLWLAGLTVKHSRSLQQSFAINALWQKQSMRFTRNASPQDVRIRPQVSSCKELFRGLLHILNGRTRTSDYHTISIYNDRDPRVLRTDKQTVRISRNGKPISKSRLCKALVPELWHLTSSIARLGQLNCWPIRVRNLVQVRKPYSDTVQIGKSRVDKCPFLVDLINCLILADRNGHQEAHQCMHATGA